MTFKVWGNGERVLHDDLNGNFAAISTSILSYGGGVGGDDAKAMRDAIASGKKVIVVPPGTYTMKSTAPTFGSATNPSCFELRGLTDVWIMAYGATFLISNAISGPVPATTLSITNNSKNCGMLGGTFVGNYTGLAPGAENVAINFDSVTGITIRDVKITGQHLAAFAGVYIFDTLIENVQAFNNAIGIDFAHTENVTVRGCRFQADSANPVTGINHHYDTPTLGDNVVTTEGTSPRSLLGGGSNRLRMLDTTFVGFGNSIAIEDMQGAVISRCSLRGATAASAVGTAGVLLYLGTAAQSAGMVNNDTIIEDCEITGCGTTSGGGTGGGVLLSDHVTSVAIRNSRIFDNTGYGVAATSLTGLSGLSSAGNDFATRSGSSVQIAPYQAPLIPYLGANSGDGATGPTLSVRADAAYFARPWNATAITAGGVGYMANNTALYAQDAGGVDRPLIGMSPSNIGYMRSASDAAYVSLQNMSGADCLIAGTAGVRATKGFSAWNVAIPAVQPPAPVTLADVIAIIRGCGLSA